MTLRQRQHLLAYLGYYSGTVDGVWGPLSIQAAMQFQQAHSLPSDGNVTPETEQALRQAVAQETPETGTAHSFWTDIRYFVRDEFRCTCGGRGCNGFPAEPAEILVRHAEAARSHFGSPADVSSGVRCQLRNSELPGSAANSLHLRGKAMDFRIRGVCAQSLLNYVRTLPQVDEAYAIDENFVHLGVCKYEGGA